MSKKINDKNGVKCICGHYISNHVRGQIEKFHSARYHRYPLENRLECTSCECPKFKQKSFWLKIKNFPLKEK